MKRKLFGESPDEAFPIELKQLRIGGSMLARFDARWLKLTHLVVLEVSCFYFGQFMRFWCRFATMIFHHTCARSICARSACCARWKYATVDCVTCRWRRRPCMNWTWPIMHWLAPSRHSSCALCSYYNHWTSLSIISLVCRTVWPRAATWSQCIIKHKIGQVFSINWENTGYGISYCDLVSYQIYKPTAETSWLFPRNASFPVNSNSLFSANRFI